MTSPTPPAASASGIKMPPTLVIIFTILALAVLAGEILPRGTYERGTRTILKKGETTLTHVVADGDTLASVSRAHTVEMPPRQPGQPAELLVPIEIMDAAKGVAAVDPLEPGAELRIRKQNTGTRSNVVVAGTFKPVPAPEREGFVAHGGKLLMTLLQAPVRGFEDKKDVIAFILIIGGAFGMVLATGAIDTGLRVGVRRLSSAGAEWLLIPGLMILFSAGGATLGMSEETIPFVMITVPLMMRLGYDSITGICVSWLAAGLGFAGATTNPFTVQIAQGIAGVQPLSGLGLRLVVWAVFTTVGIAYVMWWAARIKREPRLSPVYESDLQLLHKFEVREHGDSLRTPDLLVLLTLVLGIGLTVFGVEVYGWYMTELAAVFLGIGILSAIFGRLSLEKSASAFTNGAADLIGAALVVAFSAGIVIVMGEAQILDTVLNAVAGILGSTYSVVAAVSMFLVQVCINFFVPSGSGQAALTMPIMAPLADLIGIERQTAVLAFQFGDGIGNMIIPTSAVTMAVLGIANIPWGRWARWVLPLMVVLHVVAAGFIVFAVLSGYR